MNPQPKQIPDHYATCNGCGIGMTESEIQYTSDDGHDYCNDCNDAIQLDDESSGRLEPIIFKTKTIEEAAIRLQAECYAPYRIMGLPEKYNFYKGFMACVTWQSQQDALGNADTSSQHSYSEQEQWVSVDERLPEDRHWCLVMANKELFLACYKHGIFETEKPLILYGVTHWMPLPAPPKQ